MIPADYELEKIQVNNYRENIEVNSYEYIQTNNKCDVFLVAFSFVDFLL